MTTKHAEQLKAFAKALLPSARWRKAEYEGPDDIMTGTLAPGYAGIVLLLMGGPEDLRVMVRASAKKVAHELSGVELTEEAAKTTRTWLETLDNKEAKAKFVQQGHDAPYLTASAEKMRDLVWRGTR